MQRVLNTAKLRRHTRLLVLYWRYVYTRDKNGRVYNLPLKISELAGSRNKRDAPNCLLFSGDTPERTTDMYVPVYIK